MTYYVLSSFFSNENLLKLSITFIESLISAYIFWLAFNYFPEKSRNKKIRPNIEFTIYEVSWDLHVYLRKAFSHKIPVMGIVPSKFQSGDLTREDFELALQDKCLNETYLYGEFASIYLIIGEELLNYANNINDKIEQLYLFMPFLSSKEILILKKISVKIYSYSYTTPAVSETPISGIVLKPVVPNVSYMAKNFHELYELYFELEEIMHSYKYIDLSINYSITSRFKWKEVEYDYNQGKYKKVLRRLKVAEILDEFPDYLWKIKFLSLYHVGKINKALNYLQDHLLSSKLDLKYLRSTFNEIYDEGEVKRILIKARSKKEYEEMVKSIQLEEKRYDEVLSKRKIMKKYYDEK